MTTYFGMHMSLTFIHDLCYVSYYFEVIKGFKRSKKVKKGHFFLIWKWLKKWSIYFFKGKKTIPITFFHKKNAWKYFFLIFEKMKISLWNNLLKKSHAQNNGPKISTTNQHNWHMSALILIVFGVDWSKIVAVAFFFNKFNIFFTIKKNLNVQFEMFFLYVMI